MNLCTFKKYEADKNKCFFIILVLYFKTIKRKYYDKFDFTSIFFILICEILFSMMIINRSS